MEVIAAMFASLVAMAVLAGIGLMTIVALAAMLVLGLLTEMSFRRVFFVSFGIGLIAPLLLAFGIGGAIADGSFERDLRTELGDVVQLPDDIGENWPEKLAELQEISRERDLGNLSEEEARQRVEAIFSEFEDLQIRIDVDGDGQVIGETDTGVPLELPEPVEAQSDGER